MTPAEMIILTFVGIPLGLFLVYLVAKIAAYGVLKGKQIFDREAKQDNFDREAKQDKDNNGGMNGRPNGIMTIKVPNERG